MLIALWPWIRVGTAVLSLVATIVHIAHGAPLDAWVTFCLYFAAITAPREGVREPRPLLPGPD